MGGVVGGVILDGSVLLADDSDVNGAPTFRAGADFLFRALQFSQLHKVFLFLSLSLSSISSFFFAGIVFFVKSCMHVQ